MAPPSGQAEKAVLVTAMLVRSLRGIMPRVGAGQSPETLGAAAENWNDFFPQKSIICLMGRYFHGPLHSAAWRERN